MSVPRRIAMVLMCLACTNGISPAANSQGESGLPLPGSSGSVSAPIPGNNTAGQVSRLGAPTGSTLVPGTSQSVYEKLPINAGNAAARLEELRNLCPPNSRPKDYQEAINSYCEWLTDLADAHWRLAQSFSKVETTKPQADSEKQLCLKFGSLKRQAMLLKAEFLVGQKRYPEALGPLVDIVAAEPRTETGQSAYRLLQDIGFSENLPPAPKPSASAPSKPSI